MEPPSREGHSGRFRRAPQANKHDGGRLVDTMPLIRLLWMCTIGLVLAVCIYALALLFAVTIIGLPVAAALMVIGTRVLTLRL
jgi:uncharacterized membrane protein YccF (DUF307 family)